MMTSSTPRLLPGFLLAALLLTGCGIFGRAFGGSFERRTDPIVLSRDRPPLFARDEDGEPDDEVGTLERRAGDTLVSTGYWHHALIGDSYFLISDGGRELFILRRHAATYDDLLFDRLTNPFRLNRSEDVAAWGRAKEYVGRDKDTPIEIATDNLLKTRPAADSSSVAYLVTRVLHAEEVEYQITCSSPKKGFDADYAALRLVFHMVTGRWYSYEP
jgi:hypothetical protein